MEVDALLNQNSCDYRGINRITEENLMAGIKREIKEQGRSEGIE